MNTLRMIIRMYYYGTAIKAMTSIVNPSRNTIRKYIRIWNSLGMSYEEFCSKSDEELSRLFPIRLRPESALSPQREALDALLPAFSKRLDKKGVTSEILYKYWSS